MASCVTCHEGKLSAILTAENFTLETCKSCHPVTGSPIPWKPQPALADAIPHIIPDAPCASCHSPGNIAPTFAQIHNGYDKKIYAANGDKYSEKIAVTIIDNATFASNVLTFWFSASGSAGGLGVDNITPTVMVGQYAWNTKDFLGYVTVPAASVVKTASGNWQATANLSAWAAQISDGTTRRVELAVRPAMRNASNTQVALNAASRTFDLGTKKLVNFYTDIAVVNKCNNCHDALATTFHSPDRGGNVVVCRMCHIPGRGGSHLEMASRSIDSYAHAIHTFQDFDIDTIDFDNTVESMFHDLKIETTFPTFGLTNCVACHATGKFNPPDQSKSLPGVLSASDNEALLKSNGLNRQITTVPMYITGPASRACGGCHRAELVKEDAGVELASFNTKMGASSFMLETTSSTYAADFLNACKKIMANFEDNVAIVVPTL